MKSKHITVVLIALSLIAVTFVSTAVAATQYDVFMSANKKGKAFTFTILTTTDGIDGPFDGRNVDYSTIVITIVDSKGRTIVIQNLDSSCVVLEETLITINLVWQDVPTHATSMVAVGNVGTDGSTFSASGPGWGWGGVR
jgi:hypothetical protein